MTLTPSRVHVAVSVLICLPRRTFWKELAGAVDRLLHGRRGQGPLGAGAASAECGCTDQGCTGRGAGCQERLRARRARGQRSRPLAQGVAPVNCRRPCDLEAGVDGWAAWELRPVPGRGTPPPTAPGFSPRPVQLPRQGQSCVQVPSGASSQPGRRQDPLPKQGRRRALGAMKFGGTFQPPPLGR